MSKTNTSTSSNKLHEEDLSVEELQIEASAIEEEARLEAATEQDQSDTEVAECEYVQHSGQMLRNAPWGEWSEDDLCKMVVRGPTFLKDKVKIDCGPPLFRLAHCDIFYIKKDGQRAAHVASRPESYAHIRYEKMVAKAKANGETLPTSGELTRAQLLSPMFIINFMFPGPGGVHMHLCLYFQRRVKTAEELRKQPSKQSSPSSAENGDQKESLAADPDRVAAFDRILEQFITGDDAFRDGRLKIVPRVAEGSWVVKKSIGRVPAILGRKVKQIYYYDPVKNYFEVDADLGTSMMAGRIISLIKGTCKGLVVDMSFILQGETPEELPESLMGGVRMSHVNIDNVLTYDENAANHNATTAVYDI